MLVAMAVTLLMMAALAKAFNFIGQKVRDSRVEVGLSGRLRDVTHRMKEELGAATVQIDPVTRTQQGDGYIVYFEGPLSDSSGVLLGPANLQDSKFGDFDDYLAFTAKAPGNQVFQGKVPRFVLDQNTAQTQGVAYDPANFPGNIGGALDPVVITSKYAEVIYFASPVYQTAPDQNDPDQRILVYDASGNPQFVDNDGDLIPDRIQLHRRVLLIRPDLNLANGTLPSLTPSAFDPGQPNFNYLGSDLWPADGTTASPAIKTPGTHGLSVEQNSRAWLIGMSPIHQYCDLSVRRNTNAIGAPTATVSANSLADLTQPDNRFAHVRAPKSQVGLSVPPAVQYTSMPLLAMGGAPPLLAASPAATPATLNGFLRPEFVLGWDLTHTDLLGDGWGIERLGEDVLASNVIGFDVQIFDPQAQLLLAPGADGNWGVAGSDDDLSGTADDASEAGASNSDDVLVGPNDPGYSASLSAFVSGGTAAPIPALQGDFVDLFYPRLAGGSLQGSLSLPMLETDFSGYRSFRFDPTLPAAGNYPDGLYKSGRLVRGPNGSILIQQPAYDTFTDGYEHDGFLQRSPAHVAASPGDTPFGGAGTLWWLGGQTLGVRPPSTSGTTTAMAEMLDWGAKGFDDVGPLGSVGQETSKPFAAPLRALRVRVRLQDPNTQLLEQMSAVVHFDE